MHKEQVLASTTKPQNDGEKVWRGTPRNKCRLLLMWWDLRHEKLVCQVTNLIQPFSQKGNCCYMA